MKCEYTSSLYIVLVFTLTISNINSVLIDHSYVIIIIIIIIILILNSMYIDCYAYSESYDEL